MARRTKIIIPKGGMICAVCSYIGNFIPCPKCGHVNGIANIFDDERKKEWLKKEEGRVGITSSTETL